MSARRRLRVVLVAAACVLAGALARPARAGDAPPQPWEVEVERQSAEQTAQIEAARRQKSMDRVVRQYASRVGRAPTPVNRYLLGRALYWNDDPVGARTQMQLVLQEDPTFYPARVRLAILFLDLKNYPDAEREASAVLAVRPGNAEAREVLLRVAVEQKDWARALRLLSERLDREPGDDRTRAMLVDVHLQRKDWDAALAQARLLRQKDPGNPSWRMAVAVCLLQKGEVDPAVVELEGLARERPGDLEVLDRLRAAYAKKRDWEKVRTTLERMVPNLPADKQKEVLALIEELRKGPPSAQAPAERKLDWAEVFRAAEGPDRDLRERALRAVVEGAQMELLPAVPGRVIVRVALEVEPDAVCRAWAVRLHAWIRPPEIPILALALRDPDASVRMLAVETLGDLKDPLGIVYLLPFVESEITDVVEYQNARDALSRLTGHRDLPPGATSVTTAQDVAASRESWRRWYLSDASSAVKLSAIEALVAAGAREPSPERHLVRFAMDPDFQVMRVAYRAMREATGKGGQTPPERKVFPRFPSVPDAEVTRAAMHGLQQRIEAWWAEFLAERRAWVQTTGAGKR